MKLQTDILRYKFIFVGKEISFCNVLLICEKHLLYIKYFSYNYGLNSALLPHPNTQSPGVTQCNQSLW